MTDGPRGADWVAEAEKLLLSLKNIAGVNIALSPDGRDILEVNVLSEGQRAAKQIVRDVRSALKAEYQLEIDYRKISVAQKRDAGTEEPLEELGTGPTVLTLPSAHLLEEPAVVRLRYMRAAAVIDHTSCRMQVELCLGDREVVGEASGANSKRVVPRLVAEATLDAASKFLDSSYAFALSDVEIARVGDLEVVLVVVKFYKERFEKDLTGSSPVTNDLHQSVVYATLSALNRFLGRLRYREPVEYEIRPTSVP